MHRFVPAIVALLCAVSVPAQFPAGNQFVGVYAAQQTIIHQEDFSTPPTTFITGPAATFVTYSNEAVDGVTVSQALVVNNAGQFQDPINGTGAVVQWAFQLTAAQLPPPGSLFYIEYDVQYTIDPNFGITRGYLEGQLGGNWPTQISPQAYLSLAPGTTVRQHMLVRRLAGALNAGQNVLSFRAMGPVGHTQMIDNIRIYTLAGDYGLGEWGPFNADGVQNLKLIQQLEPSPNLASEVIVALAFGNLATSGITVPGMIGEFWLNSTAASVGFFAPGGTPQTYVNPLWPLFAVPNNPSLVGLPITTQSIQFRQSLQQFEFSVPYVTHIVSGV